MTNPIRTIISFLTLLALYTSPVIEDPGAEEPTAFSPPPAPSTVIETPIGPPAMLVAPGTSAAFNEYPISPTVVSGTEEQLASVEWALTQFTNAGLELGTLVIELHDGSEGCDGYGGVYRPSRLRVDLCNPHRLIVLHELAHAWEYHTLTDDLRHQFMELRGLTVWNDHDVPWEDRGAEDLAEVVAWGLRQLSDDSSQHSRPEMATAFELVTGIALPVDSDELRYRGAEGQSRPSVPPEFTR